MTFRHFLTCALLVGATAAALPAATAVAADNAPAAKPAPPRAAARKKAAAKPAAPPVLEAATAEQLEAAERVYYGLHQCEFGQTVDVGIDPVQPGYVDVRFGKASYVMKPVLSSTGAIRLEDVRGETLMVQITAKSMLMDVKAGHRLVDECVSDKHREASSVAAGGASAPATR